ncbi:MAG: hypothetical protein R6U15_01785 [Candidatus Izemoplasmatales bacterium]
MTGLFLIIFLIVTIFFTTLYLKDKYNDWEIAAVVFFIVFLCFLIAIPISRLDSKTNANYVEVLQETIDYNRDRDEDLSVFERTNLIKEINEYNIKINQWKVKGEKWYQNKWYLHPSTQDVKFIK